MRWNSAREKFYYFWVFCTKNNTNHVESFEIISIVECIFVCVVALHRHASIHTNIYMCALSKPSHLFTLPINKGNVIPFPIASQRSDRMTWHFTHNGKLSLTFPLQYPVCTFS